MYRDRSLRNGNKSEHTNVVYCIHQTTEVKCDKNLTIKTERNQNFNANCLPLVIDCK